MQMVMQQQRHPPTTEATIINMISTAFAISQLKFPPEATKNIKIGIVHKFYHLLRTRNLYFDFQYFELQSSNRLSTDYKHQAVNKCN
jgi:hypothetical protein